MGNAHRVRDPIARKINTKPANDISALATTHDHTSAGGARKVDGTPRRIPGGGTTGKYGKPAAIATADCG